jgi:hypothetical protein
MKFFSRPLGIIVVTCLLVAGCQVCLGKAGSLYAGYKGLPWGSSLADVSAIFPGFEDLGMSEDDVLHIYMQKNPIEGIDNRLFYFWNNKLVRVRLFYSHAFITEVGAETFIGKMTADFGEPKNQKFRENIRLNSDETWDILQMSWEDANTSISFESKEMRSPDKNWVYELQFQSVKLFKEIKEGREASEPERDWGW